MGREVRCHRVGEVPGEAQEPQAIGQVKVLKGAIGIGILHRGCRDLGLTGGGRLQNKAGGVGVQCVLGI